MIKCLKAAIQRRVSEVKKINCFNLLDEESKDCYVLCGLIFGLVSMCLKGLKLELCTSDRVGLLSDVTRIFRENSLTVTRAEVKTKGEKALNTFYVRDASGYQVDAKTIESIRQVIGQTILQVKGGNTDAKPSPPQDSPTGFLFGVFKSRSFVNFGLIRS